MLFADRHAENLGKIRVMSKLISTMIRYLEYENANIGRAKDAEESVRSENKANRVLVENAVRHLRLWRDRSLEVWLSVQTESASDW